MNFELPCGICPTYDVSKGICISNTMEICHFKPVMDHHQNSMYQFSTSYLFETKIMLNNNTRCLKLIFLCQCVQYGPTTSNTYLGGISLRGPFLPYQKKQMFCFSLGATMVRHVSPKFATTFQLTFYLGQKNIAVFHEWSIYNLYTQ